ncbi:MAG: hypothetical protein ACI9OJ_003686 [Myxococcota bacterium]
MVEPLSMLEPSSPNSLHLLLLAFFGWVNRHQNQVIDDLIEENRILRGQLGGRRLRLTDHERVWLFVEQSVDECVAENTFWIKLLPEFRYLRQLRIHGSQCGGFCEELLAPVWPSASSQQHVFG